MVCAPFWDNYVSHILKTRQRMYRKLLKTSDVHCWFLDIDTECVCAARPISQRAIITTNLTLLSEKVWMLKMNKLKFKPAKNFRLLEAFLFFYLKYARDYWKYNFLFPTFSMICPMIFHSKSAILFGNNQMPDIKHQLSVSIFSTSFIIWGIFWPPADCFRALENSWQ